MKTVKALVCEEGCAEKGELVVGGSSCAVGAQSRKLVETARVVEVSMTLVEDAASREEAMFADTPGFLGPHADVVRSILKAQQRLTRGLTVGTLVRMN